DDAIKCFRKAGGCRRVQRLVNAGEDAAIQQNLQDFLGADVEFFREIADRYPFSDRNFAGLARGRSRRALNMRGTPLARTHSSAHRMQFALAFLEALFHRGACAGGRLAFVDRLAGLGPRRNLVRWQRRCGTSSRTGWAGPARHWVARAPWNRLARASSAGP